MDEEALIARAKDEREKIFQRYDKGREPGAEIDPWENPKFEVYHQTDRYGFIHDKRLPAKPGPHESKALQVELGREKKWIKLLGHSSQPAKRHWDDKTVQAKVRKRVFKGIPEKVRGQVWHKLLNLDQVMNREQGKYKKMLELARNWSTEARQIDKDVNRQFRDHMFYRERYSDMQKSLFNVLVAYSMYNSEVGYCQGMSGLAGVLLMYMNEEEAFWALSVLLADKKFAMHGLFIEGFPKLTRFLAHHDKIITKFIPKLKKHFDQCNLDSILYSLKWFFVVFIERIPFSLCLRVWDIYLLDGEKVVTAMAYNILRMHKQHILKLRDMDQIVQYIQTRLCQDFGYDDDTVIKNLEQCMEELRKAGLELPPPPSEIELPKKEFGIFVEPTAAAQIGRRKQEFTETEKDVTETVKLKREITELEIANLNRIATAPGGSTQQLNTVHIPESEDGGSLLGSSRKSLADTSVTSTADLSVLSGGQSQRSHQAFDFCVDDQNVIPSEDEGDGESSPVSKRKQSTVSSASTGTANDTTYATAATSSTRPVRFRSATSAIGATSVVERSPSALQLMTPRAMSPHDVLRIYVPPAPPEEVQQSIVGLSGTSAVANNHDRTTNHSDISGVNGTGQRRRNRSSRTSYNDEDEDEESKTRRNSEIDLYLHQSINKATAGTVSGNGNVAAAGYGSGRYSDYTSGEFQGQQPSLHQSVPLSPSASQNNYASNGRSTSSSRRGSMSRKSPAPTLDSEFIIECSHLKNRKYVPPPDHHSSHNSLVLSVGGGIPAYGSRNGSESNIHRMTSFEELAKTKLQHHLSGSGGSGAIAGSSSSLLRSTTEDYYAVRQTVSVAKANSSSANNRMARSEIYESIESREESHYDSPRRQQQLADTSSDLYDGSTPGSSLHKSSRGHKSDYNIQYRNLSLQGVKAGGPVSPLSDSGGDCVEYRPFKSSSRQNSGNDSSPFDYDPLPTDGGSSDGPINMATKRYNRFFNNDEDDDDDLRRERDALNGATVASYHHHREDEDKLLTKSSDDSSTSPPPPVATSRPSQLPQYQREQASVGSSTGSHQRQRPRQRQPPSTNPSHTYHQNGTTPTNEMTVPLLPVSPVSNSSTMSDRKGYSTPMMHSDGTTSPPPSSAIPVSSAKRKYSTESSSHIPGGSSTISTPTGTRRRGSNASASAMSPPVVVHSRIPVGLKSPTSPISPTSPTGSLQGSFRSGIPTQKSSRLPTAKAPEVGDRLPQYQYGTASGPASLALSPPASTFQRAGFAQGSVGSGAYSSNRLGSSRSAHQIQSDSNKIRIQINPSQSYSNNTSTGG